MPTDCRTTCQVVKKKWSVKASGGDQTNIAIEAARSSTGTVK